MDNIESDVHKFWYAFSDYMVEKFSDNDGFFDSSKMIGYDAMCIVEEYAKDHPEIKIVSVDDSVFASSILVFVPHPKMGITVIFIPQCTAVQSEFFLYPYSLKEIVRTLSELDEKL